MSMTPEAEAGRDALVHYLEQADLQGIEAIELGDIITGVALAVRVERADDDAPAVLVATDVDWITVRGLFAVGEQVQVERG